MSWWPEHPDDEWVEITSFGSEGPEYIRGRSVIAEQVALARAAYFEGVIESEELERRIGEALAA